MNEKTFETNKNVWKHYYIETRNKPYINSRGKEVRRVF